MSIHRGAPAPPLPRGRRGSTLLELVVVLAILGIVAGLVGLSFRGAGGGERDTPRLRIAAARRQALERRHAVTLYVGAGDSLRVLTAYPDGRVAADSALGIDPLTGRPRAAR